MEIGYLVGNWLMCEVLLAGMIGVVRPDDLGTLRISGGFFFYCISFFKIDVQIRFWIQSNGQF
jgi:hypothetical protein